MRGLHGLAWRGLRARPLRTALTTIGVALGVAVLYAGLATNAGIGAAVDRAVTTLVGGAELRVGSIDENGLSSATLALIEGAPGVDVAAPSFERRTYLGTEIFGPGPLPAPVTLVGIDPEREPRIHDLSVAAGTALSPDDDRTVLVSATLARQDHLSVGSRIGLQGVDEPVYLRVGGILAADGPWGGPSGRAVVTQLSVAQAVFGADGVTRVDLDLAAGVDPDAVVDSLQARLLSEPYLVSSPLDIAAATEAATGDFAATTALIAAIALFAGAFLIFNTLSMTVVERLRELGLLRAAGATRRQLTTYILMQAAVIGVIGSAMGIIAGGAAAAAIAAWIGPVGAVPLGAPVVRVGDAVAALVVGVGVTLAAAVEPARRAGRVAPVEALRSRLNLPPARRARLRWLVGVLVAVGVVGPLIWPHTAGEAALVRAFVVYAVLLAVVLIVPLLLPGLARVAGTPFLLLARLEERLGRASVLRDRSRAALTVGALTIGLALIVALGGVGQHARAAAGAWIADVVPGDLVLTSIFPRTLDEGIDTALATVPGVRSVSPVATFDLAVAGRRLDGAVLRGADLDTDGRLHLIAGDRPAALAALDDGGSAIVPAGIAARDGLVLGSVLSVAAADGSVLELTVIGVAERTMPGRSGESILVGWADAERLGVAGADAYAVRFDPTASAVDRAQLAEEARALALEPVPLDRIQGAIGEALDRVFGLFDVLSLIAVIVASLGIVNTLTMNVLERVREIGVLRAAGMTRRQVWRSVVVEAGITGLAGAICGVATGVVVGGLMVALSGGRLDPTAAIPWLPIGVAFVLGVALAMLAAAYPARLAAGISIVRAVGFE
jgi:putative ABC transport system permease protein